MGRSPKPLRVNIRSVAKVAGVSPTTVSRVLNNSDTPSDQTRQRVLAAVAQTGYKHDPSVSEAFRRQRTGQRAKPTATRTIGYLAKRLVQEGSGRSDGYYSAVVTGIHEVLEQHQYHLLWSVMDFQSLAIPASVVDSRVDGLLIEGDPLPGLRQMLAGRLPTVFIDRMYDDVPADLVLANYGRAMRDQLDYLWQLGHRNIVAFHHDYPNYFPQMSMRAFDTFFADKGTPVCHPDLCRPRSINPETHEQVLNDYALAVAAATPRPTAVVADGNVYAIPIMNQLRHQGLNVPRDISVLGLNDQQDGHLSRPQLTSYQMPMREMGKTAAEALLQRIADPGRPHTQVSIVGRPIERASCGPAPVSH